MGFLERAKDIFGFLLDCLFPRCCVLCNGRADGGPYCNLCSRCAEKIPWIRSRRCSLCSRPMDAECDSSDGVPLVCNECREDPPCFSSGMSCWRYSGVGRDIVLALKYRNADFLVNDLAHLIRTNCQEVCSFAANSVLVPVPIHYFRRVKRGYNQAEVIARAVSKIASGSGVVNALTGKNKVSQAGLRRTERLINVKNTFQCSGASGTIAKDARVIVVDDVATTGATARECCRVLRMAGFVDLHVLMLSYGG